MLCLSELGLVDRVLVSARDIAVQPGPGGRAQAEKQQAHAVHGHVVALEQLLGGCLRGIWLAGLYGSVRVGGGLRGESCIPRRGVLSVADYKGQLADADLKQSGHLLIELAGVGGCSRFLGGLGIDQRLMIDKEGIIKIAVFNGRD